MNISDSLNNKIRLTISGKSKFKVLCVSDIHGGVGYDEENTVNNLKALLENQLPDLVLFLGDIAGPGIIHISTTDELRTMLTGLTRPLTELNIPWAHVFGNHDDNFGLENSVAQKVYEEFPLCLSKNGPDNISGSGNWCIPVYDGDRIVFCVWGLDSHRGTDAFRKQYGISETDIMDFPIADGFDPSNRGVDFNQVMWYSKLSEEISNSEGKTVPGLMVMHVPVFEMGMVSCFSGLFDNQGEDEGDRDCQGFNSGLVRACVERGDIKAMCFGHNHGNNYCTEFCGIRLCYDGYLSMHASHKTNTLGGRIFEISARNPADVKTYPVLVRDIIKLEGNNYEF